MLVSVYERAISFLHPRLGLFVLSHGDATEGVGRNALLRVDVVASDTGQIVCVCVCVCLC